MADQPKLLIVGAGGFGRTVAETVLRQGGYELAGFLDDGLAAGDTVFGRPVLGPLDAIDQQALQAECAIVAIGDNQVRADMHARLVGRGLEVVTVIHPDASVAPSASVGDGVVVMGGVVVGTEAQLGNGVIVNAGATVDHHAVVEEFGHVGAGSVLAGGARVGERAWLRAGCVLGYRAEVEPGRILPPGTVLGE
ncbi:acetyltransferase [Aquisalimonas asiatica]|uniref:Sugar O-acyltransferase, sialic acid O-acetyltransferase NeuD family n=1 Tax=Aquisalimonas asiatica TaxID=406100 RepID=A0A1H8SP67_9GAMM|nr:acetyltransferase [Aquisalimonas asiatica]SEO80326.1 sugar O-acyltransferase, sialic acid O-acetyltransferase NeuD family [Aquisalimonas asiatica]